MENHKDEGDDEGEVYEAAKNEGRIKTKVIRRTLIPEKPNVSLNLMALIKNSIGKELSRIPMPVNFNEPLSMLQRLTEDLEYSSILDEAAQMMDSREQLAAVAAFTVSSYASTVVRTTKPLIRCWVKPLKPIGWKTGAGGALRNRSVITHLPSHNIVNLQNGRCGKSSQ